MLPGFWGTWLYQSTLFDLANTVLASKGPVETICMNSVGYRTHRAVTGPMSFKKSRRFVGKPCSRGFGAPGYIKALYLTLQTLFWLKKKLCRDHMHEFRGLQNPSSCHWSDEFQKITTFCRKTMLPGFGAPGCHPSTLIDIVHTALASKCSVKTICMNSVGYRTHRAVTGPMSFKKITTFLSENRAPGFLGHLAISKHFI